jgi:hypothetical protein
MLKSKEGLIYTPHNILIAATYSASVVV